VSNTFVSYGEVAAVLERHGITRDQYTDVSSFLAVVEQHLPDHAAAGKMNGKTIFLEAVGEEMIRLSLQDEHGHYAKSDYLTPFKAYDRKRREVYAAMQVDPAVRRGMYGRALNTKSPHLNSRDGHFRGRRVIGNTGDDDEMLPGYRADARKTPW
jgi:hypothetical protein